MTSRDIGPQLPPNRRSRQKFGDSDGDRQSVRPLGRDRFDDRRERNSDRYHSKDDKDRNRSRDREWDRSRGRDRERDRGRDRERVKDRDRNRDRDWERVKGRERERERSSRNEKGSPLEGRRQAKSISKRSKTDRTYNTDTEESSDDQGGVDYQVRSKHKSLSLSPGRSELEHGKDVLKNCDQIGTECDVLGTESTDPLILKGRKQNLETKQREECKRQSPNELRDRDCELPHQSRKISSGESEEEVIGPALPPHLMNKQCIVSEQKIEEIGPVLPPHLKRADVSTSDDSDSEGMTQQSLKDERIDDDSSSDGESMSTGIGPLLPKHMQNESRLPDSDSCPVSGPSLPPHLVKQDEAQPLGPALPPSLKSSAPKVVGPALPPGLKLATGDSECDEDDEIVGPLLPEQMVRSGKNYLVQSQLEKNAAEVRRRLEGKDVDSTADAGREKWMLELPPEGTIDLGLGPRTFRIRGAPEKGADRSAWTDTPADKARKEEEAKRRFEEGSSSTSEIQEIAALQTVSSRDKYMEDEVKKHSKKRSKESLLEAHQKKITKKKKKEEEAGKKQERRPFNRDIDLKTNVFDDAQKKSIFKKAQFLDSRFSRGESKYL